MKPRLLDTNLLIALLWPSHTRHEVAIQWFTARRSDGWATCPITEAGFVRIVSNPAFSRDAVMPHEAVRLLVANTAAQDHQFWPDGVPFAEAAGFAGRRLCGHQQVTDAYLLGLAMGRGGVLATLDGGIAGLVDSKSTERAALEVIG